VATLSAVHAQVIGYAVVPFALGEGASAASGDVHFSHNMNPANNLRLHSKQGRQGGPNDRAPGGKNQARKHRQWLAIMRAYRRGGQSYHAPDKDLEPQVPEDAGTSQCAVALWEFFWQGYRYSESIANDKLAAAASAVSSGSERTPKLSQTSA
jgi:hypothetical protein